MPEAKVLIVEDEFLVAIQLEDILADAGYRVVGMIADTASLARVTDPPEVALVDVNLRDGPTGPAIAQLLSEKFGTRIIYVTATPQQIASPAATATGVVQKPFQPSAVLAAVQHALSKIPLPPVQMQIGPTLRMR
ncbi:MAG: response regulator [Novosphingobium sp.]